jgi:hypothetical protein
VTATFTSTHGNYTDAEGTGSIVIKQLTPTVKVTGGSFDYDGQAHPATAVATGLNGAAVAGTFAFAYSPEQPINAGTYAVTATFTSTDGNYTEAQGTGSIVINKVASTTVVICQAGPFTYTGQAHNVCLAEVTGAGNLKQPVSVSYDDNVNAGLVRASATFAGDTNHDGSAGAAEFTIGKATPVITWANPAGITFGTPLSSQQLNATANVNGTFVYNPAAGTVLNVGADQKLHVLFNPGDRNYNPVAKDVLINVEYRWDGFLQPINETAHDLGAMSKFKTGQAIPTKFVLKNAAGAVVQQTGSPEFARSGLLGACDATATLESVQGFQADVVPQYKWDGSQYHYNWSTKGLTGGLYRIFAKLADGTTKSVDICLTK